MLNDDMKGYDKFTFETLYIEELNLNIKVFNKTGRSLVFKGKEKLYGTFDGFIFISDTGNVYLFR